MNGAHTRGHAPALAAVRAMIAGGAPHAILVVGPTSVGKTTLALDLAAGLLCDAPDPADRPCRSCRGCRLVASGNHPDLHRLAPGGAGNQIKIGATTADPRPGIRELIAELSLMPVEAGARVAIVEGAQRMNEDAQNALLKTLEEPPGGVVIVLCADDEDRLLPTIRSRCQRIRLGSVGGRAIEDWLAEGGLADAPTAAALARLAEGRPGLALAYLRAGDAVAIRAELDRSLLDLVDRRPSARLAAIPGLLARSRDLALALARAAEPDRPAVEEIPIRGRAAGRGGAPPRMATLAPIVASGRAAGSDAADDGAEPSDEESATEGPATTRKLAAPERRRGALTLIEIWRRIALDLARAELGDLAAIHDPALLEEIAGIAARLTPGAMADFLARLDSTWTAIEGNAGPELAMDALVLAWPSGRAAA